MTTSQPNVEAASKMSLDDLRKTGRFNLRVLAQELGLFDSADAKNAFMALSNDDQVSVIFNKTRKADPLVKEIKEAVRETNWRAVCIDLAAVIRSTRPREG